ncbi:agmatine deiminase family protein [Desulfuromonas carbonis]|uniref:agmatine deiminase family protein n=1 Tax=Desulfuromonas sp. DDH964 TaxID=1823759 RepID=UPI00078E5E8F|nr:agmatine deiminase family protein [Desulfuromonas sp. DDH964]AMV71780.1 agmatine deiminase [Desulfuromonas sp. DDH964]
MNLRLPAEWEEQDGILLAWPHPDSDWAPWLFDVEPVFIAIAAAASRYCQVLIVAPQPGLIPARLEDAGARMERLRLATLPTNDTWARDFGPITVLAEGKPLLLDFGFNGWGLKFPADRDNQVTRRLAEAGYFGQLERRVPGLVLEGGSIESDGNGLFLTTAECLLGPNRNPHLDRQGLEGELQRWLGASHILWLENGYLAGDDTDSHIDTLARLCPDNTIVYVSCPDPEDEHHAALGRMAMELQHLRNAAGEPFRLLALPWPQPIYDAAGNRLPATYANFLVLNGAVLVPTYADPADAVALAIIGQAFPGRDVIGIDCRPLLLQHGSLHCVTMQLPAGVLAKG